MSKYAAFASTTTRAARFFTSAPEVIVIMALFPSVKYAVRWLQSSPPVLVGDPETGR